MFTLLGLAFLGGVMRKTMRISRLKLYIIAAICFGLFLIGFDTSLTAARAANWLGAAGFVVSIIVLIFTRRTSARLLTVMLLSMSLIAFTTGIINWRNQTGQAIDHQIIEIDDHSTGELRLFTYHIIVNQPTDQEQLQELASGLAQEAEEQHALRFYFYDYPEFYKLGSPFAAAEYGPGGYWNRAAHWEVEPSDFSWNFGDFDWAQQLSQTEAAIVKTWHDLHQEYTATMGNQANIASISDEVAERFAVNSTAVEAALIRFENWTGSIDE